jgi:hypothetical protein
MTSRDEGAYVSDDRKQTKRQLPFPLHNHEEVSEV